MGKVESKLKDALSEIKSVNPDIRHHEWIMLKDREMFMRYPKSEFDCEQFAGIVHEQPPFIEFLEVG